MVNITNIDKAYDAAAVWYEEKYVNGGWENNIYMKDEKDAWQYWSMLNLSGKIVSLGCGSGQDIPILDMPNPNNFEGYDISQGMLDNAKIKFPDYSFTHHDCNKMIDTTADILVSIFGTANYLGIDTLLQHYNHMNCKHAFFVFYDENYVDGIIDTYYGYTKEQLEKAFEQFNPDVRKLNNNYYIVAW